MPKHKKLSSLINPVFKFLQTIPKGKVTTYGAVTKHCKVPSAWNVSWILKQNTLRAGNLEKSNYFNKFRKKTGDSLFSRAEAEPDKIPCYKVVRSDGRLAKGSYNSHGLFVKA